MENYQLNESDAILKQVAKIALEQNTELSIDVILEICSATSDFSVAISKLLGIYVRPTYESKKIIKKDGLKIEAIAYDFNDFNKLVHYRYKDYKLRYNPEIPEDIRELVIKTDYCSLNFWNNLDTPTSSSTVDIAL